MDYWIDTYDAALADKPFLASIYDQTWRCAIRSKLLGRGEVCYLGNAFGYQAPLFEKCQVIREGWQAKLEKGASVLLPILSEGGRKHLARRMRESESTSAEEEILLAGGFAQVFDKEAIAPPEAALDQTQPEFEVNADGHRILVEAKGRFMAEAIEQERELRRKIESVLGINVQGPLPLDDKVDQWIKNKVFHTLRSKSKTGSGFVLVLSLYTCMSPPVFLSLFDVLRELAAHPGEPTCFRDTPGDLSLSEENWALAICLVSGGSIQGVWFNPAVCARLGLNAATRERICSALKNSFFPREDGVFFDERMNANDHNAMLKKMT